MQRHDAVSHATSGVAVCDGCGHGATRDQPANGSADHADGRPLPWRALLRYAGGWVGASVGALLLDLRTSRGVHPGAAGVRVCERDHSGVLAEGDLRVPGDGGGVGGNRVYQHGRVGAPHVHNRDDVVWECVLYAVDDAGGDSDWNQDVQLAGDDLGRARAVRDADAVLDRISVSVGGCWADGNHAVSEPMELAAAQFVFCSRALSLRAGRRDRVHDIRGDLLLVSEDDGADAE